MLICTSWIESIGYDLIALLDTMHPSLYEDTCGKALRVILDAANSEVAHPAASRLMSHLSDQQRSTCRVAGAAACCVHVSS